MGLGSTHQFTILNYLYNQKNCGVDFIVCDRRRLSRGVRFQQNQIVRLPVRPLAQPLNLMVNA
jgi:hypothetical protein